MTGAILSYFYFILFYFYDYHIHTHILYKDHIDNFYCLVKDGKYKDCL